MCFLFKNFIKFPSISLNSQKHGGMFLSLLSRHPSPQANPQTQKHSLIIFHLFILLLLVIRFVYAFIQKKKKEICLCIILELLLGLPCAYLLSALSSIGLTFKQLFLKKKFKEQLNNIVEIIFDIRSIDVNKKT